MKYTLKQLAFLKQVAFFRHDAHKDMLSIGISKADADAIVYTEAFKHADIVQWWTDYGNTELGPLMEKYLNKFITAEE